MRKFSLYFVTLVLSLGLSNLSIASDDEGSGSEHEQQIGEPMVATAVKLIMQGVPVIDVRQEACQGYVKGAELISIEDFAQKSEMVMEKVLKLVNGDKEKEVAIYCRSGGRAGKVEEMMHEWGFQHVRNLGGVGDYFDPATMEKCQ